MKRFFLFSFLFTALLTALAQLPKGVTRSLEPSCASCAAEYISEKLPRWAERSFVPSDWDTGEFGLPGELAFAAQGLVLEGTELRAYAQPRPKSGYLLAIYTTGNPEQVVEQLFRAKNLNQFKDMLDGLDPGLTLPSWANLVTEQDGDLSLEIDQTLPAWVEELAQLRVMELQFMLAAELSTEPGQEVAPVWGWQGWAQGEDPYVLFLGDNIKEERVPALLFALHNANSLEDFQAALKKILEVERWKE